MLKKSIMFLTLLLITSCTTKHVLVVDSFGRNIPQPHYVSRDLSGSGITVTFYFVKYELIEDVDKTQIKKPIYLEWRKEHEFLEGQHVEMIVECQNPNLITYVALDRISTNTEIGIFKGTLDKSKRYGVSNQEHRQFKFQIPTGQKAHVTYSVEFTTEDGFKLFSIGPFRYYVK